MLHNRLAGYKGRSTVFPGSHPLVMRFESALVAVATLAVLATCTPLQTMPNATRIPLSRRASFIKDDGYFDRDRAMKHIAHVKNKYRQNTINFRRNVGGE